MISSSLDDTLLSDSEFTAMLRVNDSEISTLKQQKHEYNGRKRKNYINELCTQRNPVKPPLSQ